SIRIATTRNAGLCDPTKESWHVGPVDDYWGVCINAPTATSAATHTDNKVVIAHEIGHNIARMNNGPIPASDRGDGAAFDASSDPANQCHRPDPRGHKFHSREFVGMAAKEGFGHLIAAAAYNSRVPNGEFRYYRDSFLYNETTGISNYNENDLLNLLLTQPSGNYTRYTNNVCAPPTGFRHLGSERDWLDFFWALWTEPDLDLRFSVNQLNHIWDGVDDNAIWTYCVPRTAVGANVYCDPDVWFCPVPVNIAGENGWTCMPFKWMFVETVACPGEDLCPVATPSAKYKRGKSWGYLKLEAARIYNDINSPDYNAAKYQLFVSVGNRTGVTYQ
ncbi:MAG TPA: hypothetical protein PLL58_05765, partial [Candidatus Syntrophosphaera sp.]|nr:hypothetical protein [Candidatus Syntrophosphaera sp.]